ncbi:hypothetical protein ESCO_002906 [Escovopsis weberi]|uniref:Uncharacterized protein n=1 Tax=Escovopsis weberi TaxID=150374 RepID=A0A0M8N1K0_ESCWE|nr:hypothetical protein ESCO_002906 [Escovopsis weberi]
MFHPKRGNNAAEVRMNIEPLDVSEEARALLRGVYPEGHRAELPRIGSSALPDLALPMSSRSLCPPVKTKAQNLQTTYTTAGTIYDPNSRLLIQPPNRRGRSSKHGPAIPLSDQALITGSASVLDPSGKLESSGSGRMTTAASLKNYTPLQQNYDRAINPINPCSDLDHQRPVSMPVQMSRKKVSDGLPSYHFDPDLDDILGCAFLEEGDSKDRLGALDRDDGRARSRLEMKADARDLGPGESIGGDGQDDEGSEKENDWGMDPLMNMPVKSLHNLASYPNPNQKKAQKILLMGAKPKLMKHLKLGSSLTTASGSELSRRPESSLGQDECSVFDGYPQGHSFPMADDHKESPLGNTLGSGAPKPLTAGPPVRLVEVDAGIVPREWQI